MSDNKKTNWKLFLQESIVLVLHLTLAIFFARIAVTVNDLYHARLLAAGAAVIAALFLIPLLIHILDLWARLLASAREESWAVAILKTSISIHRKLFGENNSFMAEKLAMLADVYYEWNKMDESRTLFDKSWTLFEKSSIKFPPLHPCVASYTKLLDQEIDREKISAIKSELVKTKQFLMAQKVAACLVTFPSVFYIYSIHALEQEIQTRNANMQATGTLKGINALAKLESLALGNYAAGLVYADYANAFEDANQTAEMAWCNEKAISVLKDVPDQDPFLTLSLMNQRAYSKILISKNEEARKTLAQVLEICRSIEHQQASADWSKQYNLRKIKEKAELRFAELERLDGNFDSAERLYLAAAGLTPDMQWQSAKIAAKLQRNYTQAGEASSPIDLKIGAVAAYATHVVDAVQQIDRLHKLQHIEYKLHRPKNVLEIQKRICELLDKGFELEQIDSKDVAECDFGVREASRELDVCSLMLAQAGDLKGAAQYKERAENLRNKHSRTLHLDTNQQDELVEVCTTVTNGLLAAKYRAENWQSKIDNLNRTELKTPGAQMSLSRLPWYDPDLLKKQDGDPSSKVKRVEVDISPLCIRYSPNGNNISVDVQGKVKIIPKNANQKEPEEQKFNFAYLVSDLSKSKSRNAVIEGLLDNQPISSFNVD